ncbi:MAG TPA: diacylglycerol kinase family protein [Ktedonobacteraceae bacterium]|jgi:diacylglycerol kinase (ATP)|nr:diacylglycerol kinase family protein [Ktedonobacteraceae bacterium]
MGASAISPLVILNPAANRGDMSFYRAWLPDRVAEEHGEYRETTQPGDANVWAMQAAREGRPLVVVGGDGSLNEVISGILAVGGRVPLGIIPTGSGNDFAWYALKLPRDPKALFVRAFHGHPVDVDAGVVNGRYFVNSFGVGLDADVAVAAGELKKVPFLRGTRLYYAAIMRQMLFGYQRCPWLKFGLDEEIDVGLRGDVQERRYILLAVSNGPTYGAGFRINPKAVYNDGFFDVCAIDYLPQVRALSLLSRAKRGEHEGLPVVHFYRVRKVHIESREPVNTLLDGETTRATSFHAEVLPGALQVRV